MNTPVEYHIQKKSSVMEAEHFLLDNLKLKYAKVIKAGNNKPELVEKATSIHISINKLKNLIEDYYETLSLLNQNS